MLNHKKNNENSMLIYNLTVIKNFKMKICIQDESREKQRSSAKTTLVAPELAQKGSLNKHWNLNKVSVASVRNHRQALFQKRLELSVHG